MRSMELRKLQELAFDESSFLRQAIDIHNSLIGMISSAKYISRLYGDDIETREKYIGIAADLIGIEKELQDIINRTKV